MDTKVEYTGVVAGMSGSPVYLDGKAGGGAGLPHRRIFQGAHRRGDADRDMLEISALDRSPAEESAAVKPTVNSDCRQDGCSRRLQIAAQKFAGCRSSPIT
jgi:hypothetical protein